MRILLLLAVAAVCRLSVSADVYLDIMEKAVSAYTDEHMARYLADVERDGVQEHGFPRLTANLGVLVANGRLTGKKGLLARMMTCACRDAAKGKMPPKSGGNEFSVKELAIALRELERAQTFPAETLTGWKQALRAVKAERCYTVVPKTGNKKVGYNWCVFGAASEQARLAGGLGGDPAFVEKYVADQLRWFDANGMWRDPKEPAVYDLVTRLQFAALLHFGYDGASRAELEAALDRGSRPTLKLLSACGEIPYGGRSNQFLHNHTFYAALAEWYAARYAARGDRTLAAQFKHAANRAIAALQPWLAVSPLRHVKNMSPQDSGLGCEGYAYFNKYMVTMGSWAMLAREFANDVEPKAVPAVPDVFVTSPHFHWVFLSAGDYSAQFDYAANLLYDCDGLGRLHRRGAPPPLCLSAPCAKAPHYRLSAPNERDLAIMPVTDEKLVLEASGHDENTAWAKWRAGELVWLCRLTDAGLTMELTGPGEVALSLPCFASDGEAETKIEIGKRNASTVYRGWACRYATDGTLRDTGVMAENRNGRYRCLEVRKTKRLRVSVCIERELLPMCLCGEAPERANDFFWENDCVGFRAYGPGDIHKWSGIDVFNKCCASNVVVGWLRENWTGKWRGFHKNHGLGMDDYAVGPGRGVGGVALRKDGKWLPDYGNWYRYRVLTNSDEVCGFELDYRLPIGGTMTLAIDLRRGESLFRERVMLSEDVPADGLEIGVGLDLSAEREHTGDVRIDAARGLVSLFEKPHDREGEEGAMMSAIVCEPSDRGRIRLVDGPNGGKLILAEPGRRELTVHAGADWTCAGRFQTAGEWHDFVTNMEKMK